jgi:putative SOS response-associated peptidase YedK
MCGRFLLISSPDVLAAYFSVAALAKVKPHYNIAPSQLVAAVGLDRQGRRDRAIFRWGLVPSWAQDPKKAVINARSETVASLPTFAESFRQRRCLIPADGFYEWKKLAGKRKQPFCIRLVGDKPFAFAGIWDSWKPPSGGPPLFTCAILTTRPNELAKSIHDRMPAILAPKDYDVWIDRSVQEPAELKPLLAPYPAEEMHAFPIGPFVNDAKHEGAECLTPAS